MRTRAYVNMHQLTMLKLLHKLNVIIVIAHGDEYDEDGTTWIVFREDGRSLSWKSL